MATAIAKQIDREDIFHLLDDSENRLIELFNEILDSKVKVVPQHAEDHDSDTVLQLIDDLLYTIKQVERFIEAE